MRCSVLTNTYNLYLIATIQEEDVETWCSMQGEYEYSQEFAGLAETKYPGAFGALYMYRKNLPNEITQGTNSVSFTTRRLFVIKEVSPFFNLWLSPSKLSRLSSSDNYIRDGLMSIETKFRSDVI